MVNAIFAMPSLKWGPAFEIDHLELFAGDCAVTRGEFEDHELNKTFCFQAHVHSLGPPSHNCLPRAPALYQKQTHLLATAGRQNFSHCYGPPPRSQDNGYAEQHWILGSCIPHHLLAPRRGLFGGAGVFIFRLHVAGLQIQWVGLCSWFHKANAVLSCIGCFDNVNHLFFMFPKRWGGDLGLGGLCWMFQKLWWCLIRTLTRLPSLGMWTTLAWLVSKIGTFLPIGDQ